jgi:hypothetical protein
VKAPPTAAHPVESKHRGGRVSRTAGRSTSFDGGATMLPQARARLSYERFDVDLRAPCFELVDSEVQHLNGVVYDRATNSTIGAATFDYALARLR